MFAYCDNYVRKQISSNCEDAVQICISFCKRKYSRPKKTQVVGPNNVCAFLSMLMRVKTAQLWCTVRMCTW